MVIIDSAVYENIEGYILFIIRENMCSRTRSKKKAKEMIDSLLRYLGGAINFNISPYKEFGNPQGYRLYPYQDKKSKATWGFAYERLENGDAIVRGMKNTKLIKESDGLDKIMSLMERLDNLYK